MKYLLLVAAFGDAVVSPSRPSAPTAPATKAKPFSGPRPLWFKPLLPCLSCLFLASFFVIFVMFVIELLSPFFFAPSVPSVAGQA